MNINWTVRVKNRQFWMAIVPAALLLVQAVAAVFGYKFDFSDLQARLLAVVEAAFLLLTLLGIVNDPTTKGIGDSQRALAYEEPHDDGGQS